MVHGFNTAVYHLKRKLNPHNKNPLYYNTNEQSVLNIRGVPIIGLPAADMHIFTILVIGIKYLRKPIYTDNSTCKINFM